MFTPGKKGGEKKSLESLRKICKTIEAQSELNWSNTRNFLHLVVAANIHSHDETYVCFHGKVITKDAMYLLNSKDPNALPTDPLVNLVHHIDHDELPHKITSLNILRMLLLSEENRTVFVAKHLPVTLALKLIYYNSQEKDFPLFEVTNLIFVVLRVSLRSSKDKLTLMENNALEVAINYLKDIKKLKFKEKALREKWLLVKDSGYLFVHEYHKEFYDKDHGMTQYLCSLRALDFLISGIKRKLYTLHKEISFAEVKQFINENNIIYCSVLCKVYEGRWDNKDVAIKVFDPNGMGFTWDAFLQEISLLALIEHPNACRFYGASTEPANPFIIMQYFPRGSLKNLIEQEEVEKEKLEAEIKGHPFVNWRIPVDTSLIVNMCMNAANGINYLHTKNIIHRDIKAANFLIDEHFNVYVIDYGVSRVSPDDPLEKQTIVGTPVWMAPEVLSKLPYSSKADSYSFSLVLWGMVTGRVPYANVPPLSLPLEVCFRKYREKNSRKHKPNN